MIQLGVAFWALMVWVATGSAFAAGVFCAMAFELFLWLVSTSREH
jgi:hypothetical protein